MRKVTEGEKRDATVTAKVPMSLKERIADLMSEYDRTESYIVMVMLERGLAAYGRDTKLKEPESGQYEASVITVRADKLTEEKSRKEPDKKRRA